MNSFFDLSKSQKQSLSINELHGYTDRFEINKYKIKIINTRFAKIEK